MFFLVISEINANAWYNQGQRFGSLFYWQKISHMFLTVDKGPKVSFMTTLDRELFPIKMPQNRFGNEICPLRGAPHRGPGCYENEDVSTEEQGTKILPILSLTLTKSFGCRTCGNFDVWNVFFLFLPYTQIHV